jgi:hypothetical protein
MLSNSSGGKQWTSKRFTIALGCVQRLIAGSFLNFELLLE